MATRSRAKENPLELLKEKLTEQVQEEALIGSGKDLSSSPSPALSVETSTDTLVEPNNLTQVKHNNEFCSNNTISNLCA